VDNACHLEPTHPAVKIMITEKAKLNNKMIFDVGLIVGTFRERVLSRIIDMQGISNEWKARIISDADQKLNKIRDAVIEFNDDKPCSQFMSELSGKTRDMDFGSDDISHVLSEKLLRLSVVYSSLEKSMQIEPELIDIHDSTESDELDREAKSMMNELLVNPINVVNALSWKMRGVVIDEIGNNTSMTEFGYDPSYEKKIKDIIDFYSVNIMTLSTPVISMGFEPSLSDIKNYAENIAQKASMSLGIEISARLSDAVDDVFNVVNKQLQFKSSLPSM